MKKKPVLPASRAHIYYGGRVQGVGFRYTVEAIAHRIGVLGFVKNLPDGRVELVCEGDKEKVDAVLEEIRSGDMGRHIQNADCRWEEPAGEFTDFTVEFHY